MSRIKVIEYNEATGKLKEIYDQLIASRGKLADVHTIQSLRPKSIVKHMDLYLEIMFSKSELSRAEREMMAVVVSQANGCQYCQKHHAEALQLYWKNEKKVAFLVNDFTHLELSEKDTQLCHFARKLTLQPASFAEFDATVLLRDAGLSDSAILDATLVVAYFNFVNRIVLALDVRLETDSGKGYKY
jgi:uncharacterized peroxidase-related enzyme